MQEREEKMELLKYFFYEINSLLFFSKKANIKNLLTLLFPLLSFVTLKSQSIALLVVNQRYFVLIYSWN